jgi:hypothetical protein
VEAVALVEPAQGGGCPPVALTKKLHRRGHEERPDDCGVDEDGDRPFVLGATEFVGPFEPKGWRVSAALVPIAYVGWSIWLLTIGVGLLIAT